MMKRFAVILLAAIAVITLASMTEAAVFSMNSPFTSSYTEILTNFDANGDHAVITYESTDNFGSYFAVLLNSDGVPVTSSATFGWAYLFGDTQADGSINIYGSNSGLANDWTFIGNF
jgi:hypothetical protein